MKRIIPLVFLLAAPAFGQPPKKSPYPAYGEDMNSPRAERQRREEAVAFVGHDQVARSLVETYGDDACYALFACSPAVAKRLAEWHNTGDFERRISKPKELLRVIAAKDGGDEAALYAMNAMKTAELSDPDCLDAFLASPAHYFLAIKKLSDGAAEIRARRMRDEAKAIVPQAPHAPAPLISDRRISDAISTVIILGICLLIFLWWRKRQADYSPA